MSKLDRGVLNKVGKDEWSLELPISYEQYSRLKGLAYEKAEDLEILTYIEQRLFGEVGEKVELSDRELVDIKVRLAEAFIMRGEVKSGKAVGQEVEALINKSIIKK